MEAPGNDRSRFHSPGQGGRDQQIKAVLGEDVSQCCRLRAPRDVQRDVRHTLDPTDAIPFRFSVTHQKKPGHNTPSALGPWMKRRLET